MIGCESLKKDYKEQAYMFMEFAEHQIGSKIDFNVGKITLVLLPFNSSRAPLIYVQELRSTSCFNLAIEWN